MCVREQKSPRETTLVRSLWVAFLAGVRPEMRA